MSRQHGKPMEAPVAKITRKIGGGCADRSCPAVWELDDPEMVGIQGSLPVAGDDLSGAGEIPSHEGVLIVPRALLLAWASGQR
jgi:hypothetical protein